MNKLIIIGNVTKNPEVRQTPSGTTVCDFTVAVNRRKTQSNPEPGADFFRIAAWGALGELCAKYLSKGKKASVIGSVSVRQYTSNDGEARASLEVNASEVEFLSPRGEQDAEPTSEPASAPTGGFTAVETDELPF
jgi:single-strand DNA-binding protein